MYTTTMSTEDLTLCVASARALPTITAEAFTQHAFESRVRRWVPQSSVMWRTQLSGRGSASVEHRASLVVPLSCVSPLQIQAPPGL